MRTHHPVEEPDGGGYECRPAEDDVGQLYRGPVCRALPRFRFGETYNDFQGFDWFFLTL